MSNLISGKVFGKDPIDGATTITTPAMFMNWNKSATIDLSLLRDDHAQLGADAIRENRIKGVNNGHAVESSRVATEHQRNMVTAHGRAPNDSTAKKLPLGEAVNPKSTPASSRRTVELAKSQQPQLTNKPVRSHPPHVKLRPATSEHTLASAKWLLEENKKVSYFFPNDIIECSNAP